MTTRAPWTWALTAVTSVLPVSWRRLKTNEATTPSWLASDSTHLARPASVQASTKSRPAVRRAASMMSGVARRCTGRIAPSK